MAPLAIAAIAAVTALVALGQKKPSSTAPHQGADPAVAADLAKLYAANVMTYNAVNQALGEGNPSKLIQYAAQLMALYPALAKQMGDTAAAAVTPTTGSSGTTWNLWGTTVNAAGGGVPMAKVDVLLGAQPVLSYSQVGTGDQKVRTLLGVDPNVDSATLARAHADFGV